MPTVAIRILIEDLKKRSLALARSFSANAFASTVKLAGIRAFMGSSTKEIRKTATRYTATALKPW
jgi:hypothetical protein